jgi:hypothetical protein
MDLSPFKQSNRIDEQKRNKNNEKYPRKRDSKAYACKKYKPELQHKRRRTTSVEAEIKETKLKKSPGCFLVRFPRSFARGDVVLVVRMQRLVGTLQCARQRFQTDGLGKEIIPTTITNRHRARRE